jgi:hypothetical protein
MSTPRYPPGAMEQGMGRIQGRRGTHRCIRHTAFAVGSDTDKSLSNRAMHLRQFARLGSGPAVYQQDVAPQASVVARQIEWQLFGSVFGSIRSRPSLLDAMICFSERTSLKAGLPVLAFGHRRSLVGNVGDG